MVINPLRLRFKRLAKIGLGRHARGSTAAGQDAHAELRLHELELPRCSETYFEAQCQFVPAARELFELGDGGLGHLTGLLA